MAYDFVLSKDLNQWVEDIQWEEEKALKKLAQYESKFIQKLLTCFYDENTIYGVEEMKNYRKELIDIFSKNRDTLNTLDNSERALLYKLIAILSYGIENNESLAGLGD